MLINGLGLLYLADKFILVKNIFTGTLAFIVYAGLCLLLFNYLFTNTFVTEDSITNDPIAIAPASIIDELPSIKEDSLIAIDNSLNVQLDSIAAAKLSIDQDFQEIDGKNEIVASETDSLPTSTEQPVIETSASADNVITIYEANTFTIKDDKGNEITTCSNFTTIYKNNPKVKIPYTCRTYGNDLKELLIGNPKAQVLINGYSSDEEDNDMGIKRAQYVKNLLANTGIDSEQIIIKDAVKKINFSSGIAQGGIDIQLMNWVKNVDSSVSKETTPLVTKPKPSITKGSGPYGYRRFTTGYQGDYFYGNGSFKAYMNEVNAHLNSNSSKKVYVYAYTDTVGNATDNYNIGKDNVNTARRLMIQNGIPENRIVAVSKGEASSGATDNNRSMVIIVK